LFEALITWEIRLVAPIERPWVEQLAVRELLILLWNGNPDQAKLAPLWRPLTG
jgi:hypothetical protein